MAVLSLSLLGPFSVKLAGEPVTNFESNKVRALLAYLAVEADRPHHREKLMGLLWPSLPERTARDNLRHTLASLRRTIGDHHASPPFLLISRETIQFNPAGDHWLDVAVFQKAVETFPADEAALRQQAEALNLYRGSFLEGLYLKDSLAFEEWSLLVQGKLQREALQALGWLAGYYEGAGDYPTACAYAWRQVELEPWQEEAHRQLMRLLALSGQRSAALVQYETCRRLLAEELGVEPSPDTTALYEKIKAGEYSSGLPLPLPTFPTPPPASPTPFVARERELAHLDEFLTRALAGQGQVVFVRGEAGSGKTVLVREFIRRAQERHLDLIAADGNCNAHTGPGDPYLPFREILGMLTGEVEAKLAAGALNQAHARRLWALLPRSIQTLVSVAPALLDVFVPAAPLLARVNSYAPGDTGGLAQLQRLLAYREANQGLPGLKQSDLFEQYVKMLQNLAQHQPLLLALDDLQWADTGSIGLLFHLGRRLAGSRILVVGIYRPADVALGWLATSGSRERHPLEAVVNELQRHFGSIHLDLSQAAGRDFVEAFLDTEPNRLGQDFRQALYQHTRGHALFTVEMLRGMQERGDIIQDEAGRWVESARIDWQELPARIEGVIGERLGRLPTTLHEALKIASVQGEVFTAELLARVQAVDERALVQQLSGVLDKQHRLIQLEDNRRLSPGGQRLSRYRFRHILFQKYLYDNLDEAERAYLHEAVGQALAQLYGEETGEVAVQLARHFERAGLIEQAVTYLRQAGEQAIRLSANEEAITHFSRGLALLKALPDTPERTQAELALQIALGVPLIATRGYAAPEVEQSYARARALCQQVSTSGVGETPGLFRVLWGLTRFYLVRTPLSTARDLGQQLLSMAQRAEAPELLLEAHNALGAPLFHLGELALARIHLEQGYTFYDPDRHRVHALLYGQDPGVVCLIRGALALWGLGYPAQALARSEAALDLARDLDHPFSQTFALGFSAILHQLRREVFLVSERTEAALAVSLTQGFANWVAGGRVLKGWTLLEQGQMAEGIAQMRQGLADYQATGAELLRPYFLGMLAEGYREIGQQEAGLAALAEALALVDKTGERWYAPELYRLKGELLQMPVEAEKCFHQAIELARRQQAKSWELRAAMSLSQLWRRQGRPEEARQRLAEIYGWFSEGFETVDLREAMKLLESLS